MPMTPKEIVKLLQANGFVYVSSTGSHRKYRNPQTGKTVIVPFHAFETWHREKHPENGRAEVTCPDGKEEPQDEKDPLLPRGVSSRS